MASQARRDDPDVDVLAGRELAMRVGRTRGEARRRLLGDGLAVHADAQRVLEPREEVGDREREDLLLVGHGSRVVDGEQDIDLEGIADDRVIAALEAGSGATAAAAAAAPAVAAGGGGAAALASAPTAPEHGIGVEPEDLAAS